MIHNAPTTTMHQHYYKSVRVRVCVHWCSIVRRSVRTTISTIEEDRHWTSSREKARTLAIYISIYIYVYITDPFNSVFRLGRSGGWLVD